MKSRTLVLAALAMSSLLGAVASFAEPTEATPVNPPGARQRADVRANQPAAQPYNNASQRGRDNQARQLRDRDERQRAYNEQRRNEPGAGPDHQWHRGDRLPDQYRSRQYVVDDWRGHRLSAPPRGYHWVQTGGDYVLVAIATGIIAQLLLNQ